MEIQKRRAAQYLGMPTEHQQYSTENQSDAIQVYAALRGLEIVAAYQDEGKSGLSVKGRDGLQTLIRDVVNGTATFGVIIAYDISRWGRFQDADEAAHYEFLCRRAGINVEYCAEPFQNDGSPLTAVLKGLKRAMAGEYSRELSVRVWAGQKRLVEKGYRHGATAGYGLRRQAVDATGSRTFQLAFGEHKNLRTDRVILVPGPPEEVEMVQWIYRRFIGATERSIVGDLNARGIKTDLGRPFTTQVVRSVLTSEKYIGTHVWNRTCTKLRQGVRRNKPEKWIRVPGAFSAVVSSEDSEAAQAGRRARAGRLSDEEILGPLRRLLNEHGYLSHTLIEQSGRYPTVAACVCRFGNIRATYERVGYKNPKDHSYVEVNQRIRKLRPMVAMQVMEALFAAGADVLPNSADRLTVSGQLRVSVVVSRFRTAKDVTRGWHIVADATSPTDIFVMARLDKANQVVTDYFVLPLGLLSALHFNLTERKAAAIEEGYRSPNLEGLADVVNKVRAEIKRGVAYERTR